MEKDYSLLRPFDLEAAKRGEAVCWYDTGEKLEYVGTSTGPVAGCFKWVEGRNKETFETYPAEYIRMKPLCWVEGRPVYKGDVLYDKDHGTRQVVRCAGPHDTLETDQPRSDGAFIIGLEDATWTPPKVKREVKLLAYLDDDQLFWLRETTPAPIRPAVRIPSEDKTVEVEE